MEVLARGCPLPVERWFRAWTTRGCNKTMFLGDEPASLSIRVIFAVPVLGATTGLAVRLFTPMQVHGVLQDPVDVPSDSLWCDNWSWK